MSITSLPSEILALIASVIYEDGSRIIRALLQFSAVSRPFRDVSLAYLFNTKTITRSSPEELFPCAESFLHHLTLPICRFSGSVKTIRLKPWHKRCWLHNKHYPHAARDNQSFVTVMSNALAIMTGLRTIYLEALDDVVVQTLQSLCYRPIHIVLDARLSLGPRRIVQHGPYERLLQNSVWTWSFELESTHPGVLAPVPRPCALEWYWNSMKRASHLDRVLTSQSRECIREVHFSEIMQDLLKGTLANIKSCKVEMYAFLSGIQNLKRLSIVGHELSTKIVHHIAEFPELEQLRIYSPYKKSFHPECLEDDNTEITASVAQMSWFKLNRLKSLDIRFICRHIPVSSLIPPNLNHLAVEYYDRNFRLGRPDLEYIASTSPDLEILEMDSTDLRGFEPWTVNFSASSDENHPLEPLKLFKKLRTLKLIPSYWYDDHLIPRPVLSIDWTVLFFRRIRRLCPSLRTLVICISFGECPHGSIHNMSTRLRPVKFILKDHFSGRVLLRYGIAGTKKLHERLYWADGQIDKLGTILEHRKAYFDDLSEGWILPHVQVPDWGESDDVSDEE